MAPDSDSRVGVFFERKSATLATMIALSPGTVVGVEYVLDRAIGEEAWGGGFPGSSTFHQPLARTAEDNPYGGILDLVGNVWE